MMYLCPNCEVQTEVQIMNIYPPRLLKCTRCGFQGMEQLFEIHHHEQKSKQAAESFPIHAIRT